MTKNNPLVSIIVPVYNTAKYLPRCLDSILNQTYQNLEIIIVDDGSTDNSPDIIKTYAKKDKRIKTIHQKNSGQSSARNKGIKSTQGKYISFVDSDDEIKPNFIEELLNPYQKNQNISLTVCGIHYKRLKQKTASDVYINPIRQRHKHESQKAYILYLLAIDGRMYSSVNKLYIAKIIKTCKFEENTNFAEDTKFVLDYLSKATDAICFILKPLYLYNFGTETSTINKSSIIWKNWQDFYKKLQKWVGQNPNLKTIFWLRIIHLRWQISFIRSKHRANL